MYHPPASLSCSEIHVVHFNITDDSSVLCMCCILLSGTESQVSDTLPCEMDSGNQSAGSEIHEAVLTVEGPPLARHPTAPTSSREIATSDTPVSTSSDASMISVPSLPSTQVTNVYAGSRVKRTSVSTDTSANSMARRMTSSQEESDTFINSEDSEDADGRPLLLYEQGCDLGVYYFLFVVFEYKYAPLYSRTKRLQD